ncbi:tRNA (adenine(22)-N(1))-methyltransferase [Ferviditalea candida]|uniref:Class I SAM-dependent methyltransferase n=1 Tax=Ferviditalea candida TaxID=3108399 RepID=A0ABU5ZDT9_9BACL|nr:class I SAM-dependent methyltransferase [Paenibacillaceae bacterium T2]
MSVKLSKRLEIVAQWIPQGSRLADIGTDHALLPVFLVQTGKISFAVAGDIHEGPLETARQQVAEAGLQDHISIRRGDGLAVVEPEEVDAVSIAGMGGSTMVHILSEGEKQLASVKRLVLQPNVGEFAVRRWLEDHQWFLASEELLQEDGRIYEILVADRRPNAAELNRKLYEQASSAYGAVLTKEDLHLLGPYLLQKAGPVFERKWEGELLKLQQVCRSLKNSSLAESRLKLEEMQRRTERIKEVLQCLPKVKP